MIKKQFGRFAAIAAIIALGIGLMSGLGSVEPKLLDSLREYYEKQEAPDLIVKSKESSGFTQEDLAAIEKIAAVQETMALTSIELPQGDSAVQVNFYPFHDQQTLNHLELLEGELPQSSDEILAERSTKGFKQVAVGSEVTVLGQVFKVSGIVKNPLLFSKEAQQSSVSEGKIEMVVYFDTEFIKAPLVSDLYLQIDSEEELLSSRYYKEVAKAAAAIEQLLGNDRVACLTLRENFSSGSYQDYADKVNNISLIFSFFFIAVVALVVLSTMTRLVEEERSEVGCYRTLGYSNAKVVLKFLTFAFLSCVVGCALGALLISPLLLRLIYSAFAYSYHMPAMSSSVPILYGAISIIGMLLAVLLVTGLLTRSLSRSRPAELLRPKALKPGRKIVLERIGFIWRRLSFRYKSTFRNIFRYKRNLFLTVISIGGATALLVAGFGLYDSSAAISKAGAAGSTSSMTLISAALIICSGLLSILVIYNLTNINIEERKREIATLKVLGYRNLEVVGYIYREIMILAVLGLLLGLPLGFGFVQFVFNYVNFGSIKDMQWYSWIFTILYSLACVLIVDLLLYRKILKIDMNASLKATD